MIVISGMAGTGKTQLAEILGNELKSPVFLEEMNDHPLIERTYTSSKEELNKYRYPFLLQLQFLYSRVQLMKKAHQNKNSIIVRSIYEDWYYAQVNQHLGLMTGTEFRLYEQLWKQAKEGIETVGKGSPYLNVYVKSDFENVLKRIHSEGRSFEKMNPHIEEYYYHIWKGYDDWLINNYKASDFVIIHIDRVDIVNEPNDARNVVSMIKERLI